MTETTKPPLLLTTAERAALRLAAIVEYSDDAIVSKDLNGIIQTWNLSAERIFGYSAAEAVGRSITLIIPDDRLDEEAEVIRRIAAGQTVDHYETIRRRKDGGLVDISLTISPIRTLSGEIIGASKIARDITEQRRLREQADAASRMKDEFLATLSHELRTPLNAIVGWAHMLTRSDLPHETIIKAASAILRNATAQAQIMEDLLDMSRIVTGRMALAIEHVDLANVVRDALEVVRPAADPKGVAVCLKADVPIPMKGDPIRLRQVVWNLLSNAVKFTPPEGRVDVTLHVDGRMAILEVADTGRGIPPAFLPHVFERFSQEESGTTRSSGGLGLGLAIVRHIVEAHGGTIEAASDGPDRGATFTVRLPRGAPGR
ncbi:MAG TPA: ATP-binding protein [Vicinamibacterales bacterium]|nr:ATP-binding protein [Vicinamibacterales bacterium]